MENSFSINLTYRITLSSKGIQNFKNFETKWQFTWAWPMVTQKTLNLAVFFQSQLLKKHIFLECGSLIVHIPNGIMSKDRFPVKNVS